MLDQYTPIMADKGARYFLLPVDMHWFKWYIKKPMVNNMYV